MDVYTKNPWTKTLSNVKFDRIDWSSHLTDVERETVCDRIWTTIPKEQDLTINSALFYYKNGQIKRYWTFNIEGQKSPSTAPLPSDLSRHTHSQRAVKWPTVNQLTLQRFKHRFRLFRLHYRISYLKTIEGVFSWLAIRFWWSIVFHVASRPRNSHLSTLAVARRLAAVHVIPEVSALF